jgi:cellulose synthase/poly-beta-1,6-N-acetylglucosamine synthase-like glycosyltransferase
MPTVSFIIPVKPGGDIAALAALRHVDASSCPFEILIAEGRHPSRQRNAAVNESRGEILYFLDDDSLVNPDCLAICAAALEDPAVAVAGGPSLTPAGDSLLQQLFGSALASPFGAGAVRNRYRAVGALRETTEKELILCNLAIRKETFLSLGGFNERLYPNEENELLDRVLASGRTLVHIPRMSVRRSQRRTLSQFIRQMFSYGRGRAQQSLISGSFSFFSFIPLYFVVYLLLASMLASHVIMLVPLYVYLALTVFFTAVECVRSGTITTVMLLLIYPLMHVVNGAGLLVGLLGGKPALADDPGIVVRRIKALDQDFEVQS